MRLYVQVNYKDISRQWANQHSRPKLNLESQHHELNTQMGTSNRKTILSTSSFLTNTPEMANNGASLLHSNQIVQHYFTVTLHVEISTCSHNLAQSIKPQYKTRTALVECIVSPCAFILDKNTIVN